VSSPACRSTTLALLVLLRDDERRFDRAVVRWHVRFCLEVPEIAPALREPVGAGPGAGAAALIDHCEREALKAQAEGLRVSRCAPPMSP
jgi:hypothetical protein